MNLEMCQEDESNFFKRLITQDETWVHHYDPETKAQSMQWKHLDSPPPKKARVQPSAGKVMLTVFWDQDGIVMTDFLEKGTTITGAHYASLLMKLREAIKIKRRGKISKGILLLQDNAPVHNSHVTRSEARACGYEILPHPPYFPDLAPSDFHLFPAMKLFLKGKRFPDDAALISEVMTWLEDQPGVFQKWCPELHQTMGKMHNSAWFLCRERLITVPSFINLLLWEMDQGHYLLNAPRMYFCKAFVIFFL